MFPDDVRYTAEHEWVRPGGSSDETVRVGITHFAQEALGDIVFVSLPQVGDEVTAGSPCGEVESTKSVSDVYAPVSGRVTARNDSLETSPERLNSDPYGEGWVLDIAPSDPDAVNGLLDVDAYRALVEDA